MEGHQVDTLLVRVIAQALSLIHICPGPLGKGVLVTPTVHGNLMAGPNAEPVEGDDTATTAAGLDFVRRTAARSVPSVAFGAVIRTFAGVRSATDLSLIHI